MQLSGFPAPFIEEAVFSPLYILDSFVKNKVPLGAWVYFWTFYLVPLVYILFWCQYHTVLMTIALQYNLKSGKLIPLAPFFFLRTALAIQGLLCLNMNCEIFCSTSVKNAIGNLIGIALHLQITFASVLIFTILILPTQEHGISLHLFMSSLISFTSVL